MKCQLDDRSSPTPGECSTDDEEEVRLYVSLATKVAAWQVSTTSFLFDVVPNMYLDELCFMADAITISLLTKALIAFVANMQGRLFAMLSLL